MTLTHSFIENVQVFFMNIYQNLRLFNDENVAITGNYESL